MTERGPTTLLQIETPARGDAFDARCRAALEAGFDGIELAVDSVGGECDQGVLTQQLAPESSMLNIGAVSAQCRVGQWEAAIQWITVLLRSASRQGAECLNLSIAPAVDDADSGETAGLDVLNFAFRLLRDLRFEAESSGIALALEAGACGELLSPVAMREVVDAANSWAVGVCLDINRLCAVTDPAEWIVTLHRRIHSVRIQQSSDMEPAGSRSGEGDSDLAAIGRALRRIDYDRILVAAGTGEPAAIKGALSTLDGTFATPHDAAGHTL